MTSKKSYLVSDRTSRDRRALSETIAKRLVRRRLQQTGTSGVDRCQVDGTNVAYRNQGGVRFVNCEFLDDNDTILVADERSYIDIIRLPRYDGTSTVPTRPLGHAVCKDISLSLDRSRGIPQCRKIRSFMNGKAFAVGLDYGEFQIFSTERSQPWWESNHEQLGLERTRAISSDNYVTSAYKVNRPYRKYHRHGTISLAEQLRNPTIVETQQLVEMPEWASRCRSSHWDFRETSSGSIQAVHVGEYLDNFCFRILDSRTPRSQHDICVDLQMNDNNDINSICFLDDTSVATAWSTELDNMYGEIRIWDIRMIQKDKTLASIFLPSYPHDRAHGVGLEDCSYINIHHPLYQTNAGSVSLKLWVSGLTPLHDGNFVASSGSHNYHFVIDPVTTTTSSVINTGHDTEQFAIDRQNGYVATYSSHGNGTGSRISFFALHGSDSHLDGVGMNRKKRKQQESHTNSAETCNNVCDTSFEIETLLHDRNGLETVLTHMAFNDSGSSLIATSDDGDVFLWRAS